MAKKPTPKQSTEVVVKDSLFQLGELRGYSYTDKLDKHEWEVYGGKLRDAAEGVSFLRARWLYASLRVRDAVLTYDEASIITGISVQVLKNEVSTFKAYLPQATTTDNKPVEALIMGPDQKPLSFEHHRLLAPAIRAGKRDEVERFVKLEPVKGEVDLDGRTQAQRKRAEAPSAKDVREFVQAITKKPATPTPPAVPKTQEELEKEKAHAALMASEKSANWFINYGNQLAATFETLLEASLVAHVQEIEDVFARIHLSNQLFVSFQQKLQHEATPNLSGLN